MTDPLDPTLTPEDVSYAVEALRARSKALRRAALAALDWPDHTCPDLDAAKRLLRRQARRRAAGQPVEAWQVAEAAERLQRVQAAQEQLAAIEAMARAATGSTPDPPVHVPGSSGPDPRMLRP